MHARGPLLPSCFHGSLILRKDVHIFIFRRLQVVASSVQVRVSVSSALDLKFHLFCFFVQRRADLDKSV